MVEYTSRKPHSNHNSDYNDNSHPLWDWDWDWDWDCLWCFVMRKLEIYSVRFSYSQ